MRPSTSTSGGAVELLRQVAFGPVRSVGEFFIPFRLFQVEIFNGGKRDQRVLGLDAVTGSLDLYHFEQLPGPAEVVVVETRNCPLGLLDDARAMECSVCFSQLVFFACGIWRFRRSLWRERFASRTGWDFAGAELRRGLS